MLSYFKYKTDFFGLLRYNHDRYLSYRSKISATNKPFPVDMRLTFDNSSKNQNEKNNFTQKFYIKEPQNKKRSLRAKIHVIWISLPIEVLRLWFC